MAGCSIEKAWQRGKGKGMLQVGRVSVAIRIFVHSYTRTFVYLSWTGTSWTGTAGQGPAIRTRQALDRQDFLCVYVFARPQVE